MPPMSATRALQRDIPVNVSSVPQRSPFRYPGGKTWLIPIVRRWLAARAPRPATLIEPFAGGASVGLTAAIEGFVDLVHLVELDEDVAAVWETIFSPGAEDLAARIESFDMTAHAVQTICAHSPRSPLDRAFRTIVLNRARHGGILAPGASLIRRGENDKGLTSRWYPRTIAARIRLLAVHRDRFVPRRADALDVLHEHARDPHTAWFIDPPYTVAGRRLYAHHEIDHERLLQRCADCAGDVLITYDESPTIQALAESLGFQTDLVAMNSRQHRPKREMLISRDLSWLSV